MAGAHARLQSLEAYAQRGNETAALESHLRALIAAGEGDLAASANAFAVAQEWESANGYTRAALHTSHQAALTANFGGDLARLRRYYQETLVTLKRLRNREGMALCLRSFGELALLDGADDERTKAWEESPLRVSLQRPAEAETSWRLPAGCRRGSSKPPQAPPAEPLRPQCRSQARVPTDPLAQAADIVIDIGAGTEAASAAELGGQTALPAPGAAALACRARSIMVRSGYKRSGQVRTELFMSPGRGLRPELGLIA